MQKAPGPRVTHPPVYNPYARYINPKTPAGAAALQAKANARPSAPPVYRPMQPVLRAIQRKPSGTIQLTPCPKCHKEGYSANQCPACGYMAMPAATPYGFDPDAETKRASGDRGQMTIMAGFPGGNVPVNRLT
jgi:hypothetical protein